MAGGAGGGTGVCQQGALVRPPLSQHAAGEAALVGLGVGTVTGRVFLIMAGTLDARLLGDQWLHAFVQRVADGWAATVLGCAAVCFPVGVMRAILKLPWYNM